MLIETTSGTFSWYVSDTKSMPDQAGQALSGSPVTIASTSSSYDGGTYYTVGASATARAFSGSFIVLPAGDCYYQATSVVDNSTPNVSVSTSSGARPASKP